MILIIAMGLKTLYKNLVSLSSVRPEKYGNGYFYPIDMFNSTGSEQYLKDFIEVPEVNNVINIRARSMSSGIMDLVSVSTGLPVKNQENIVKILRQPNWFQGYKEFWRQSEIFRSVYGNEFLYFNRPFGMANSYKGMFTLDPSKVDVRYKGQTYFLESEGAVEYWYTQNGKEFQLEKDNLLHLNDNRVEESNFLLGTSKLKSLQPNIRNIRAAYDKRGIILSMPVGVFSKNAGDAITEMPQDPNEKANTERNLKTNGAHPIITNMDLSYAAMNVNANSMGLFEEVKEDLTKICDAYGVSYDTLSSQKGSTFDNVRQGQKANYQDSYIPSMQEKADALNTKFEGKAWEIQVSWDDVAVFEEDKKDRADTYKTFVEALSKAYADGAITLDEYKEELKKI